MFGKLLFSPEHNNNQCVCILCVRRGFLPNWVGRCKSTVHGAEIYEFVFCSPRTTKGERTELEHSKITTTMTAISYDFNRSIAHAKTRKTSSHMNQTWPKRICQMNIKNCWIAKQTGSERASANRMERKTSILFAYISHFIARLCILHNFALLWFLFRQCVDRWNVHFCSFVFLFAFGQFGVWDRWKYI